MRLEKVKYVDGKPVDFVPTFAGYMVMYGKKLPEITLALTTGLMCLICGLIMALGFPGLVVAAFIAAGIKVALGYGKFMISLEFNLIVAIFFILFPMFLLGLWVHEWLLPKILGNPFKNFYRFNAEMLIYTVKPALAVFLNIWDFIRTLFTSHEIEMRDVILAKRHWGFWPVCAYHVLIFLPVMLMFFGAGCYMLLEKKTFWQRLLFTIMFVIPMCWVWKFYRRMSQPDT